MPDKYQELREAAKAATPGPWRAERRVSDWVICQEFDGYALAYPDPCRGAQAEKNALFIAQADPATIQALLAEHDALKHDIEEYVHIASEQATEITTLREALAHIEGLALADEPRDLPAIAKTAGAALSK